MPITRRSGMPRDTAELIAIQVLTHISGDPEKMQRFLAVTGIDVDQLRESAAEPEFLAGVLDHVLADEALLMAVAAETGVEPPEFERARAVLAGHRWEPDLP
jgi:hypothetical protein